MFCKIETLGEPPNPDKHLATSSVSWESFPGPTQRTVRGAQQLERKRAESGNDVAGFCTPSCRHPPTSLQDAGGHRDVRNFLPLCEFPSLAGRSLTFANPSWSPSPNPGHWPLAPRPSIPSLQVAGEEGRRPVVPGQVLRHLLPVGSDAAARDGHGRPARRASIDAIGPCVMRSWSFLTVCFSNLGLVLSSRGAGTLRSD